MIGNVVIPILQEERKKVKMDNYLACQIFMEWCNIKYEWVFESSSDLSIKSQLMRHYWGKITLIS